MQRINNVFDHPLSVADAATMSSFTFQAVPWFYFKWTRAKTGSNGGKGEEELCMNNSDRFPCSQVSLSDATLGMFLWVTSRL